MLPSQIFIPHAMHIRRREKFSVQYLLDLKMILQCVPKYTFNRGAQCTQCSVTLEKIYWTPVKNYSGKGEK